MDINIDLNRAMLLSYSETSLSFQKRKTTMQYILEHQSELPVLQYTARCLYKCHSRTLTDIVDPLVVTSHNLRFIKK